MTTKLQQKAKDRAKIVCDDSKDRRNCELDYEAGALHVLEKARKLAMEVRWYTNFGEPRRGKMVDLEKLEEEFK